MTEPELPIFRMSQNYLLRRIWRSRGSYGYSLCHSMYQWNRAKYLQKRKTEKRGMSDPEIERRPKPGTGMADSA